MTVITGHAQLLTQVVGKHGDERTHECVAAIYYNTRRLAKMVGTLRGR